MMKASQLRAEREEFEQLVTVYTQKYLQATDKQYETYQGGEKVADHAERAEFKVSDWQPEKLLLLRFGLPDPFKKRKAVVEEKKFVSAGFTKGETLNVNATTTNAGGDSYFNEIQKQYLDADQINVEVGARESRKEDLQVESGAVGERGLVRSVGEDGEVTKEKPLASLFDMIFN